LHLAVRLCGRAARVRDGSNRVAHGARQQQLFSSKPGGATSYNNTTATALFGVGIFPLSERQREAGLSPKRNGRYLRHDKKVK